VAVDPTVIPMGELLFIPELAGLPQMDGSPHDGCFVAEDRGIKVKGHRIDVFTGDEGTRRRWEATLPSHASVHVYSGSTRCRRDAKRPMRGCDPRHR
jgi:3D (Asp-Asp-Asp) domain-containing protein